MTNHLVGDVYLKIIEDVVAKSRESFEVFGVVGGTLEDLQSEWQAKLSQRGTAQMPWDPKPQPVAAAPAPPSNISNGLTPSAYASYDTPPSTASSSAPRIKQEPLDTSYSSIANGYSQGAGQPQGGAARAAQLTQQYAMQQRGGGLALPDQQQAKPQLHLPAQGPPMGQQQYSPQQIQAMRHQQSLQQGPVQPRIKVENESPHLTQGSFPQQPTHSNYGQTDGAGDAYDEWQTMLAQRRALHAEHGEQADRMMRDQVMQKSAELQSGLMMPLNELPSSKRFKHSNASIPSTTLTTRSSISQLDGIADDEDEEKPAIKEEDDEAINSDLDDDDDPAGPLADEDDADVDSILCTYDKVQRVKNKWKCTLKDGIMSANGKEWVFHKGMGEFEW